MLMRAIVLHHVVDLILEAPNGSDRAKFLFASIDNTVVILAFGEPQVVAGLVHDTVLLLLLAYEDRFLILKMLFS